jgi:hypothetical protein
MHTNELFPSTIFFSHKVFQMFSEQFVENSNLLPTIQLSFEKIFVFIKYC